MAVGGAGKARLELRLDRLAGTLFDNQLVYGVEIHSGVDINAVVSAVGVYAGVLSGGERYVISEPGEADALVVSHSMR